MKPVKPTYILGISAFYHDSAAALVRDGEIIGDSIVAKDDRDKSAEIMIGPNMDGKANDLRQALD